MHNVCYIFVENIQRKTPLGRFRRRCEYNITTNLKEIGLEDVDWIQLSHDRAQ
jgi:hypothetical protein